MKTKTQKLKNSFIVNYVIDIKDREKGIKTLYSAIHELFSSVKFERLNVLIEKYKREDIIDLSVLMAIDVEYELVQASIKNIDTIPSQKKTLYFLKIYEFCRNIIINEDFEKVLTKDTNEYFINMIFNNMNIEGICNMKPFERNPAISKPIIEEINKSNELYRNPAINESSIYKCKACGSRKIDISEKQVRSMDEPSTLFFHCAGCNAKWSVNN